MFFLVLCCSSRMQAQSIYVVSSPPADGSSTGLRAPNGTRDHAYHRTVTLVDEINLRLIPPNMGITRLGFVLAEGAGSRVAGKLTVYMSNMLSPLNDGNMFWAEITRGMTKVYDGPFSVPDTAGPVDLVLSTPFVFSGRSLAVAYDFQSAGPFTTKNAVFSSNVAAHSLTRTGFSSTQPPDVLTDVSDYRPVFRFGFPIPAVQWNPVTAGIQVDLNAIDIVDDDSAWVCSPSGNVYKSTDRGKSWLEAGRIADSVFAMAGFNSNQAVAFGGNESDTTRAFVTSDGGSVWSRTDNYPPTLRTAVAGKTSVGSLWSLAAGGDDTIKVLTSFDRGKNWTQTKAGIVLERGARISRGSSFRIGNVMWVGTCGSGNAADRVYKSSTGPTGPWRYSSTGRTNVGVLAFSSASGTGIAAHIGCQDTIRRSTDGGISWSAVLVPGLGEVSSLQFFAGGQDAWAATTTGIWRTSDDGLTWQRSFSSGNPLKTFSCLRFFPTFQYGIAAGSNGLIVRGTWVINPASAVTESPAQRAGYWLGLNYPNPFNSSTWMEYSVPWQSHVKVSVIDVLGREIATVFSGLNEAGRHKIEWNAGKSPSGVYFYRLIASPLSGVDTREYSETRKLILLK